MTLERQYLELYTEDTDGEPWPVPGPDPAAETRWVVAETLSWLVVAAVWLGLALMAVAIVRRR